MERKKWKVGDEAQVVGLTKRLDINGEVVILENWSKKNRRWQARVAKTEEVILIKLENLQAVMSAREAASERYVLDPAIQECLKKFVRGDPDSPVPRDLLIQGQLSWEVLETFVRIAKEMYGDSSTVVLGMVYDFIGKDVDSKLLLWNFRRHFRSICEQSYLPFVHPAQRNPMESVSEITQLMSAARRGLLAYVESKQALLLNVVRRTKGVTIVSDRHDMSTVLRNTMGGTLLNPLADNKSIRRAVLLKELTSEGRCGVIDVIRGGRVKEVKIDIFLYNAYVTWIIQDVLDTLDKADAKDGRSLREWNIMQEWEIQLTSRVDVGPERIFVDISDEYCIDSWLEGLVSMDLETLETIPGVNTDRRIIRLVFFAMLAFDRMLRIGAYDKQREDMVEKAEETTNASTAETIPQPEIWKVGTKVVLVNMGDGCTGKSSLTNGMVGKVVGPSEDLHQHYRVSFSNLFEAQDVHVSNIKVASSKPKREVHTCICGQKATKICSRCNAVWYCSKTCQVDDYKKRHKMVCKVITSDDPFQLFFSRKQDDDKSNEPCDSIHQDDYSDDEGLDEVS